MHCTTHTWEHYEEHEAYGRHPRQVEVEGEEGLRVPQQDGVIIINNKKYSTYLQEEQQDAGPEHKWASGACNVNT